ncbi:YegP family protein [Chitinophaga nivalis]|uniref:YegP family protein n=1 Tax=Chitinophaga nivalis TaxID=2991709 RepID=A0ABT3IMD8_9BACT|nr:YegP family protein [Chitinophaga nivalis]MCW3465171.1 YegP family protein [Chitinophaga nivalis]MCW3485137.1 YegP family protein [Chitinophaga nivalis]
MGKFIIKTAKDGQHYFNLKANNGQTILSSEMYTTKSACNNGIDSVKKNAPDENRYEKLVAKNGQHYFNLKASNGQVIGTSEMYESSSGRDNGIDSVIENAPTATVEEE